MKLALLSGAVKNAGDYLITERTREILSFCFPGCEIITLSRNKAIDDEELEQINECDAVIIGGGPCYKTNFYPGTAPLRKNLSDIRPRIMILGAGWYGRTGTTKEIWNYKFGEKTRELFKRIQSDTKFLGCRDYLSLQVLCAQGVDGGIMTGCPAWYDLNKIGGKLDFPREFHKIIFSDPSDIPRYGLQSLNLVKYFKQRFPKAELTYCFHRGINADQYTDNRTSKEAHYMVQSLNELGVKVHDISYGVEGFHVYDDCDLHIGYRVHAHIYNLSQRRCSILIEEDARGKGIDEAMGLWSIKPYTRRGDSRYLYFNKIYDRVFNHMNLNGFLLDQIDCYLDYIIRSKGNIFNSAFTKIDDTFSIMLDQMSILKD